MSMWGGVLLATSVRMNMVSRGKPANGLLLADTLLLARSRPPRLKQPPTHSQPSKEESAESITFTVLSHE